MTEREDLLAAVEAVLFAAGEPVQPKEIAAAFEGSDENAVRDAIESLAARYAEGSGGLVVEQVAGAYRLATKPAVGAVPSGRADTRMISPVTRSFR